METNWLLVALLVVVIWFGAKILDRLPKPKNHQDFRFESTEHYFHFRIDALTEQDFEVLFC